MTTEVAPIPQEQPRIHSILNSPHMQARIAEVLGKRAPQFASSLVSLVSANATLKKADPNSVIAAAMTAALLDLPINKDLGFAHIVPYAGVAQFQMGYKGFIQLAMRTGQYRNLNACVVFDGELVNYNKLTGKLILDEEKKKAPEQTIGYAAYMELINGFEHAIYWTAEKVRGHAQQYSQAYKAQKKDSPWFVNFEAMALKTVIKMLLSKWGILSIELQNALVADQAGYVDGEPTYVDNGQHDLFQPEKTEAEPASKTDKLAADLAAKAAGKNGAAPESQNQTFAPGELDELDTINDFIARINEATTAPQLRRLMSDIERASIGDAGKTKLRTNASERIEGLGQPDHTKTPSLEPAGGKSRNF